MSVKTCTKCGVKKPLSEFHKRAASIDGYKTQCKECLRAYSRAHNRKYYAENHDAVLEMQKDYRKRKKHETTTAPNRLGTARQQPTQAVNEVAIVAGHRMTPGEAADRLRLAEKILHDVYNLGGADHRLKKHLKDTAGQIKLRIEDFEEMGRKTRNALA